jgi:hypothetical protein
MSASARIRKPKTLAALCCLLALACSSLIVGCASEPALLPAGELQSVSVSAPLPPIEAVLGDDMPEVLGRSVGLLGSPMNAPLAGAAVLHPRDGASDGLAETEAAVEPSR